MFTVGKDPAFSLYPIPGIVVKAKGAEEFCKSYDRTKMSIRASDSEGVS